MVLDLQIFVQKLCGQGVVGVNAADLRCRIEKKFGFFRGKEFANRRCVQQIHFMPALANEILEPLPLQLSQMALPTIPRWPAI